MSWLFVGFCVCWLNETWKRFIIYGRIRIKLALVKLVYSVILRHNEHKCVISKRAITQCLSTATEDKTAAGKESSFFLGLTAVHQLASQVIINGCGDCCANFYFLELRLNRYLLPYNLHNHYIFA